jgi:hypothetical protein
MDREELIQKLMNGGEVSAVDVARSAANENLASLQEEAERRLAQQRAQEERAARREALIADLLNLDAIAEHAEIELAENDRARREATRPFDKAELKIRERWRESFVKFGGAFSEVSGTFATSGKPEAEALRRELRQRGAVLDRVTIDIWGLALSPSAERFAREQTAEGNKPTG